MSTRPEEGVRWNVMAGTMTCQPARPPPLPVLLKRSVNAVRVPLTRLHITSSSFPCHFAVKHSALLPSGCACVMQSLSIGVNVNLTRASPFVELAVGNACPFSSVRRLAGGGLSPPLAPYLRHYGLWDPSGV